MPAWSHHFCRLKVPPKALGNIPRLPVDTASQAPTGSEAVCKETTTADPIGCQEHFKSSLGMVQLFKGVWTYSSIVISYPPIAPKPHQKSQPHSSRTSLDSGPESSDTPAVIGGEAGGCLLLLLHVLTVQGSHLNISLSLTWLD